MRGHLSTTLKGALQAWPGVRQILQLPVNLIRHPPLPWPAELSTLRGGRPQQVSLIRVTVSRKHPELISPNWESEQRGWGNSTFYQGHPCPSAQPWRGTRWRRCQLPTHNVPSPVFPHIMTWWSPTTLESHKTSASSGGLCKLKIKS